MSAWVFIQLVISELKFGSHTELIWQAIYSPWKNVCIRLFEKLGNLTFANSSM